MQNQNIVLYSYFRSSTSWRVRIALNLKKIQYEIKPINLLQSEQKSEYFTKINPNQAVPALEYKGQIIIESSAILDFLEEEFPDSYNLLPKDNLQRANIRGFCQIINSSIHPLQNLRVIQYVECQYKQDKIEWLKHWVNKGFQVLEQILKENKGLYCFGDQISLADIYFIPQVQGVVDRFQFDLSPFPNIKEVYENLKNIQEFIDASPAKQIDNLNK
ncbi:maleylacetoacetate isomerase, putative [Ichthyophthirius multifiliis]|uniref:Maleylacetoacetate isomerase, putative n=1 Tax=Ichthyophthirius multifiliis TaxID=5932 RepID=G0R6C7_ICHMU|nr:maleylacetoacetate isomerase, putative [Ichthyophthirius multifiliis]EGR26969.1 maleylacetoacetate isomerase, putative [Ichthyophthirius multifiliis]|eukprot:XP_004023853.1 maleylacetoacetate isomerase, putative [Ichthyophthirius multifiliis]